MPSYDALYSFTMGIVRKVSTTFASLLLMLRFLALDKSFKLSQMRGMLIERAAQQHRSELEVMQLQTSLLLTHAQVTLCSSGRDLETEF